MEEATSRNEEDIKMSLTEEQKQAYIKDGNHCPYCGANSITVEDIDLDIDTKIRHDVTCLICKKTWIDVYYLCDIKEK